MNTRKDRTPIRLKLYEGGFTPLANKNKMCLIKGWSTLEVTPELMKGTRLVTNDWQPIETAPKDGTRILIWSHYAIIAWWVTDYTNTRDDEHFDGVWLVYQGDDPWYDEYLNLGAPTHWTPLPSAPTK